MADEVCSDETGRDKLIQRLRSALHPDIEIVTERADVIEGPGGTQLVNGRTHDVETWIDRRSRWGNPFKTTDDGGNYRRYESVELYRGWFHGHVETDEWDPEVLRGDVLGCWCLPEMCHGVVVMNHLAEAYSPQQKLVTDGGQSAGDIYRPPKIYDVVPLPDSERGRECTLWTGEGPSPCGNEATYIFVYEKSLDPDDDSRDNCICCEECKPRSLAPNTDYLDRGEP